ncbi:MAG: heavy-metal-associated domain-containing protein [Xanthomonadales bacterium]|nr:heavy-metal-associated domain-containing protein [Xanthomonadales bacterium]
MNNKTHISLLAIAILLFCSMAHAEQSGTADKTAVSTATFAVGNMSCATCPLTVKSAMKKLDGVISVRVDLDSGLAKVVFDASVVTTSEIAAASTGVGFPTSVIE